jgi:hypothetical protein
MPELFGPGVAGQLAIRSQSLQTLDFIEQCINDGNRYMVGGYATIANGGTVDITMQTPDTTKWIHMIYRGELSGAATIDFYENVTGVSGGVALSMINKNRNSANVSGAVVLFNPSVTPGDKIDGFKYGSAGGRPGRIRKMILKQNTAYLWRIVSQAADNAFSFHGEWDEFIVENGV